jgi:hypothetical protein
LRQGIVFQVSLSGSEISPLLGAFLSFILLIPYLPEICVYVCISPGFPRSVCFLDNRSTSRIGWHLLMISTAHESFLVVTSFQPSVFRRFRPVLSTEHVWMGLRFYAQFSAISGRRTALVPLPFWSSPICVGLLEVTMVANVHSICQSC